MDDTTKPHEAADNAAGEKPGRLVWLHQRARNALPTPPEWIDAATRVVATRLKRPPIEPGDRAYKIARWIVWIALGLYTAVVMVCMARVLGAMFVGSADDINKLLLALGGVVAGPFLVWRTFIAHQQTGIAREGHYTSLFTKAVEQLGATREVKTYQEIDDGSGQKKREPITTTEPNLEVRLGAIYALDRIARDSERDHVPILEVLCAYIRNQQNCGTPLPFPGLESGKLAEWLQAAKPRVDVQAAITSIGQRSKERIEYERKQRFSLNLADANLQGIIMEGLDFSGTRFTGSSLDASVLAGARLSGAWFVAANLRGAQFAGASLDHARFSAAVLEHSNFNDCDLSDASFANAHLPGVTFTGAKLENTVFDQADISRANFSRSKLHNASFSHVRIDISFNQIVRPNFADADFGTWKKDSSRFAGTQLFEIDFSRSVGLTSADFVASFGDATTRLPPGVASPDTWSKEALDPYQRIDLVYRKVKQ
ncbi:MAG: pentapeptide repeat-containing protein [Rhizobiales bacterium]|nr:pentapeptide repeat-containing protein [Hyphomicrobiales bacterium]